jgi:hypothetical protein
MPYVAITFAHDLVWNRPKLVDIFFLNFDMGDFVESCQAIWIFSYVD